MTNDLEHKRELFRIKRRQLRDLEKRKAKYGPDEAPLRLLRQIDDLENEIRELETAIATFSELCDPITRTTIQEPSERLPSENILIVEDDPSWQSTLELLLKGEGYGVIVAKDYSIALDRILRTGALFAMADLAACVMDLRFADSRVEENYNGLGLLAVCKMWEIPAIVVSAFLTRGLKNQLHDQFGVVACFDKDRNARDPFDEEEFLAVIKNALVPSHRRVRGRGLLRMEMKGPRSEMEFQTKLQALVDIVIDYYRRAHAMVNDKHRERRIARGRPSAEDEALWEQQIREIDQKYSTAIDKLTQVSTLAELDALHPEIVKECLKWVSG